MISARTTSSTPRSAAPGLIINGAISPGANGSGAMTNNGATIFGAGARFIVAVQNATGPPATAWDFLAATGGLDIQAGNSNPLVILLESFDPNGSGRVTNFNAGSNYAWTIAATAGGITNFSPDKFVLDASAFANDLAGGSFSVQTNGNSLLIVFSSRPTPPAFERVALVGTNLIASGNSGILGGNYFVLTSTNPSLPLAQWSRVATNAFDTGGGFVFTNRNDPVDDRRFDRLLLP